MTRNHYYEWIVAILLGTLVVSCRTVDKSVPKMTLSPLRDAHLVIQTDSSSPRSFSYSVQKRFSELKAELRNAVPNKARWTTEKDIPDLFAFSASQPIEGVTSARIVVMPGMLDEKGLIVAGTESWSNVVLQERYAPAPK